jgi:hypothetical protein
MHGIHRLPGGTGARRRGRERTRAPGTGSARRTLTTRTASGWKAHVPRVSVKRHDRQARASPAAAGRSRHRFSGVILRSCAAGKPAGDHASSPPARPAVAAAVCPSSGDAGEPPPLPDDPGEEPIREFLIRVDATKRGCVSSRPECCYHLAARVSAAAVKTAAGTICGRRGTRRSLLRGSARPRGRRHRPHRLNKPRAKKAMGGRPSPESRR